jgi:hypothetical protein
MGVDTVIDVAVENLVSLRDVPRCIPPRPNGKRLHVSAVYRWTLRGLKGIRLETVKIGGTTYTSREAIQRFSDLLTGTAPPQPSTRKATRTRERELERINAAVSHNLGLDRNKRR